MDISQSPPQELCTVQYTVTGHFYNNIPKPGWLLLPKLKKKKGKNIGLFSVKLHENNGQLNITPLISRLVSHPTPHTGGEARFGGLKGMPTPPTTNDNARAPFSCAREV